MQAKRPASEFTGVTRVIMNTLCSGTPYMRLADLLDVYRLSLFYQQGETIDGTIKFSLRPILTELKHLLICKHLILAVNSDKPVDTINVAVVSDVPVHGPTTVKYGVLSPLAPSSEDFQTGSLEVVEEFLQAVSMAFSNSNIQIKNHWMSLSDVAVACTPGLLSIEDGEAFIKEAEKMQDMTLSNPLSFLYLSITQTMCKPLIQDPQYKEAENQMNIKVIRKMLVDRFDTHPDQKVFLRLGLDKENVRKWCYANPAVRNNNSFNATLTRLFSALFVNELLDSPDQFEGLCRSHGFDRPMAVELTGMLASRCMNLKLFTLKLQKLWWYQPLASFIAKKVGQACDDEVRPLLELRHVTVGRAKIMIKIGLRSIRDVAQASPSLLMESIPNMHHWMPDEIVAHARVLTAQEASIFEAESADRRKLLV